MPPIVALQHSLPESSRLAGTTRWLYAGEDTAWRLRAERGSLAALERIENADLLQDTAWKLRRPFIDWIGELARANDSVEWWASQLAARNSYTLFFDRICSLSTALQLVDDDMLVVCSSPAVASEIARATGSAPPSPQPAHRPRDDGGRGYRAWARFATPPVLALPARLSERARLALDSDPRYRRRVLARHGVLGHRKFEGPGTVLFFTWVDRRNFAGDHYRDPHFGELPAWLRSRGLRVAYLARVLPGMAFDEAVARLVVTGEDFYFPDAYLGVDDARDCARRAAAFDPVIPDDSDVEDVPVASLAHELADLERPSQAAALALDPLCRELSSAGVRPERIVHTCEGHSWELTLARACRTHLKGTRVVGYENVNMSRLALSMYPAKSEQGLRPVPDLIVTNGEAYRDVLVDEGVQPERVAVGCALRHGYLWDEERVHSRSTERLRVLLATDAALGVSAEMVSKAAEAFAAAPNVDVIVKCHPLVREQDLVAFAPSLRFTSEPISALLAETDVLLYRYTVVCYEALMRGVPPVFLHAETEVDLDQLEPFAELRWEARTPGQLRSAIDEIAQLDDVALARWRTDARTAAERALNRPTPACADAFLG